MTTTISVVAEDDSTYSVQSDGATVQNDLRDLDEALEITGLLIRCAAGDQAACVDLDRRGVEPPTFEPDDVCGVCAGEGVVRESAAFPHLVECGSCHGGVI